MEVDTIKCMKGWVVIAGLLLAVAVLLIAVLSDFGNPTEPSPSGSLEPPRALPPSVARAEPAAPSSREGRIPDPDPATHAGEPGSTADPLAARPGQIQGVVSFLGDGPCAGARVVFIREGERRIVRTDAKGRFRSGAIRPGEYLVRVESTVFPAREQPSVVVTAGEVTTCTFSVPPGVAVEGTVINAWTRDPIDGARLTLRCDPHRVPSAKLVSKDAVTDDDGRFRLERVYPDHVLLEVEAEGYHPRHERFIVRAEDHGVIRRDVPVVALHRVRGRVVDAKGRPASGAEVAFRFADLSRGGSHPGLPVTDHAGKFELVPPPGRDDESRRVYAFREGSAPGVSREFTLAPGEVVAGLVIRLGRGGAVTGLVGGAGEQHAEVVLRSTREPELEHRTMTERTGQYRIEHLRPGCYTATARLGSRLDFKRRLVIKQGETLEDQNFSLESGARLEGVVVDRSGRPRSAVLVGLKNRYGFPLHEQAARTDANGHFGFADLRWDIVYQVFANRVRGYLPASAKVTARTGTIRLVLTRVFPIVGRVRMPDGEPSRAFRITVYRLIGRELPRPVFHGERIYHDPQGRFEYAGDDLIGLFEVVAQSGHYRSPPVRVRVEPEKPPPPLELRLEAAATLYGDVTSPAGERLAGAVVKIERIPGPFKAAVRTGLNGRYRIEAVRPGVYRLSAAHWEWVEVEERFDFGSSGPCRHDLILPPGGTLVLTVIDARRKPCAGTCVHLIDSRGRPVVRAVVCTEARRLAGELRDHRGARRSRAADAFVNRLRRSQNGLFRTAANGQCTIRTLASGEYCVVVHTAPRWISREARVKTGVTTRLTVTVPESGGDRRPDR